MMADDELIDISDLENDKKSSEDKQVNTTNNNSLFDNLDGDDFKNFKNNWKIQIIGVGGAGTNIASYIKKNSNDIFNDNIKICALNTDIRSLQNEQNKSKINVMLLDRANLKGFGSGGKPDVGASAAINETKKIESLVNGNDIVIVLAGLGKGTGSGATPEILKICKKMNIITITINTLPSITNEGENTYRNAIENYNKIVELTTSVCAIENDKVSGNVNNNNLTLSQKFAKCNEEVRQIVVDIVAMINNDADMVVDLADFKNFLLANKSFSHLHLQLPDNKLTPLDIEKNLDQAIHYSTFQSNYSSIKNLSAIIFAIYTKKATGDIIYNVTSSLKKITKNNNIETVNGNSFDENSNMNEVIIFISNNSNILPFNANYSTNQENKITTKKILNMSSNEMDFDTDDKKK